MKINTPKTSKSSENGEGPQFSTGDPEGNEEGIEFPKHDEDNSPVPNPDPKPPVDDEKHGGKKGDIPAIIKIPLGGMRYKAIYNYKTNCIDVIFTSKYNENNCELSIREVGLKDDRYKINIESASLNGVPCEIEDGIIKNLKIKENIKYKISCVVDTNERFASEVILNAIR